MPWFNASMRYLRGRGLRSLRARPLPYNLDRCARLNVWRKFGAWGAIPALLVCVLLIGAQRPAASALCIVVALGVLFEGVALMANWQGMASYTAEQTRRAYGNVLRFRRWEVRIFVGGFYTFMGLLFVGGGIHYL